MLFFVLVAMIQALTVAENLFMGSDLSAIIPIDGKIDYRDMGYDNVYDAIEFYEGNSTYLYDICNLNTDLDVIRFARSTYVLKFNRTTFQPLTKLNGVYSPVDQMSLDIAFSRVNRTLFMEEVAQQLEILFGINSNVTEPEVVVVTPNVVKPRAVATTFNKLQKRAGEFTAKDLISYINKQDFHIETIAERFGKVDAKVLLSLFKAAATFYASVAPGLAVDGGPNGFNGQTGQGNLNTFIAALTDAVKDYREGDITIIEGIKGFFIANPKVTFATLNKFILARIVVNVANPDLSEKVITHITEHIVGLSEKDNIKNMFGNTADEIASIAATFGEEYDEDIAKERIAQFLDKPEDFLKAQKKSVANHISKLVSAYLPLNDLYNADLGFDSSRKWNLKGIGMRRGTQSAKGFVTALKSGDIDKLDQETRLSLTINIIKSVGDTLTVDQMSLTSILIDGLKDGPIKDGVREYFIENVIDRVFENDNDKVAVKDIFGEISNLDVKGNDRENYITGKILSLSAEGQKKLTIAKLEEAVGGNTCSLSKRDGPSCSSGIRPLRSNKQTKKCSTTPCSRANAKRVSPSVLGKLQEIGMIPKTVNIYKPVIGEDLVPGAGDDEASIVRALNLLDVNDLSDNSMLNLMNAIASEVQITELTVDNSEFSLALKALYDTALDIRPSLGKGRISFRSVMGTDRNILFKKMLKSLKAKDPNIDPLGNADITKPETIYKGATTLTEARAKVAEHYTSDNADVRNFIVNEMMVSQTTELSKIDAENLDAEVASLDNVVKVGEFLSIDDQINVLMYDALTILKEQTGDPNILPNEQFLYSNTNSVSDTMMKVKTALQGHDDGTLGTALKHNMIRKKIAKVGGILANKVEDDFNKGVPPSKEDIAIIVNAKDVAGGINNEAEDFGVDGEIYINLGNHIASRLVTNVVRSMDKFARSAVFKKSTATMRKLLPTYRKTNAISSRRTV